MNEQPLTPICHDVVEGHARERPDAIAIRFEDRTLSYHALQLLVERVAMRLAGSGIGADDRVVFIGRNSDAVPVLALAANRIGAVPTPLNWRLAAAEMAVLIADARARLVFVEPEYEPMARHLQHEAGGTFEIVPAREIMAGGGWLDLGPTAGAPRRGDPEQAAVQIYTSGTTGVPKGVMLSHRSLNGINMRRREVAWDRWSAEDVVLVSAPLGHIGAYGMLIRGLFFGAQVIIQDTFDAAIVLDAIDRFGVSKIALVPTAIKMLLDHPRAREVDYGRIDTMIYGAAPITLSLLKGAMAVFQCHFAQSYGMSETSGPCVALPPADHHVDGNERMSSAGLPLPATEIRIVDKEGNVLSPRQDGEICVRSVANMTGYWQRPEETSRVLSPDGWLRTGDAGFVDEDGYVYVRARVKEMIISGAENIYPAEVENVLAAHPDVAEVAVIGVPDAHWGEAVKAIVVPKADRSIVPDELKSWARARIAGYKVPKSIDLLPALPYNATGKIDKLALRASHWALGREIN